MSILIKGEEVNFLVYKYLLEAGKNISLINYRFTPYCLHDAYRSKFNRHFSVILRRHKSWIINPSIREITDFY